MTLYRLGDTKARLPEDVEWSKTMTAYVEALIDQEVLVPVEPCEHGNTGRHIIDNDECIYDRAHEWCDGIGGDDEM